MGIQPDMEEITLENAFDSPQYKTDTMDYYWIFRDDWVGVLMEQFNLRQKGWTIHTIDEVSNSMLMEKPKVQYNKESTLTLEKFQKDMRKLGVSV